MVYIGRAFPLLFAAPSALRKNSILPTRTTLLQSTIENQSERIIHNDNIIDNDTEEDAQFGIREAVEFSRNTYKDLAEGCYVTQATPTISFQYIRPVAERSARTSEDDISFEEDLSCDTADDNNKVYDKIQSTHDNTRPLLLYLPGLDGVGISAVQQYEDMSNTFEFWRMRVDPQEDRSTFTELTSAVYNFIQDVAVKQNRKVILVGESFGGLLAPSVSMRMQAIATKKGSESPVLGMVLVNPATSFYKTNWSTWAPILASLRHLEQEQEKEGGISKERPVFPTPYSVIGGMALALTIPDKSQNRNILDMITKTPANELQDVLTTMRDGFGILADNLPAKVIEHRVGQWCNVGSQVVNPRLHSLNVPTLFIGGDEDTMLPTKEEGDRLVDLMPDCEAISVKDAGHFILDDRFNLTSAIIDAHFDPFNKKEDEKKYDAINDWKKPSEEEIQEAVENRVKPLRDLVSPKFFSTGTDGKRYAGLGKIPSPDGPLLFVANHQLIGLDLGKLSLAFHMILLLCYIPVAHLISYSVSTRYHYCRTTRKEELGSTRIGSPDRISGRKWVC